MKEQKLKVEYVQIESLKPYAGNAKEHPDWQIEQIMLSIKEFGFKDPIGIWKNEIVEGHGRLIAAKELGMENVPVIRLDQLTDEQRRAYAIVHNKLTMNTDFDWSKLEEEMKKLDGIDMSQYGFDELMQELNEKMAGSVVEDDFEPIVPEKPKAKLGDLFLLGNHRLLCGDCRQNEFVQKLMGGVEADLVVTDPPYNMKYEGAGGTKDRKQKRIMNDSMPDHEFKHFLDDVNKSYIASMKDGASIYMFYKELGNGVFIRSMEDSGLQFNQQLVWVKNQLVVGGGRYQNMYEPCLFGHKGKRIATWNGKRNKTSVIESVDMMSEIELRAMIKGMLKEKTNIDVIRENKPLVNDLHPTMKPIRLLAKLIVNSSNKDDVVIDFFGGSGSTMIACEQLERRCYTMELDPKYVDVIIERWESFTGKKAQKMQ